MELNLLPGTQLGTKFCRNHDLAMCEFGARVLGSQISLSYPVGKVNLYSA